MIVTISYTAAQVGEAERLLDFMFQLHNKKKAAAVLLVGANDTHEEFRTKIKLAAEVAFREVDMILADAANLFGAAVARMDGYKSPWVYLDAFSVPLTPRWLESLEDHYDDSPKKILGPYLKDGDKIWLGRHSIYPPDICRHTDGDWTPLSTKTRIIQLGKYTGRADMRDKSKDDPAYLFCGDKTGELIKTLCSEMKK